MDGLDDFAAVDALQVHGRDAEVAMPELALDNDQRHALPGELDGVRVAQLVGREATPHSCCRSGAAQLSACGCGRAVPTSARSVDDAGQRPDRQPAPDLEPRLELLEAPCVHADLAAAPALATPDQERATALIEIGLGERERFLDAKFGSPQ